MVLDRILHKQAAAVAKHKHDGYPLHPVAVKHHTEYFAGKPQQQNEKKLSGSAEEGSRAVAQRIVNAEERFISFAMKTAGLTRDEALSALATYRKVKAIKIDPVVGQFTFTHGGFAEPDVLRDAASRNSSSSSSRSDVSTVEVPKAGTIRPPVEAAAKESAGTDIFIRGVKRSDPAHHSTIMAKLPDKDGYEKIYKPYGEQGRGYYYTPKEQSSQVKSLKKWVSENK